jgi:hypothetical protein
MKYTIKTTEAGLIIALNRWKPKYRKVLNNKGKQTGVTQHYEVPEDLEQISKETYQSLIQREDLPLIKWIDRKVITETDLEKQARLKSYKDHKNEKELLQLKKDLTRLSKYVMLSKEGQDLIKGKKQNG